MVQHVQQWVDKQLKLANKLWRVRGCAAATWVTFKLQLHVEHFKLAKDVWEVMHWLVAKFMANTCTSTFIYLHIYIRYIYIYNIYLMLILYQLHAAVVIVDFAVASCYLLHVVNIYILLCFSKRQQERDTSARKSTHTHTYTQIYAPI